MVEVPADRPVGLGGLCGTIEEDRCQELAFVVMQNLYSGNLCRGSAPGVSGTSSESAAVGGESSFGGRSLPVNALGSGSGGASSGGQVASLGPVERYESQYMGASEFLNRRVNEELQRAFEAGIFF